jgi:streptogramin lyase
MEFPMRRYIRRRRALGRYGRWSSDNRIAEQLEPRCLLAAFPSFSEFPFDKANTGPTEIVAAPGGDLWFTEEGANAIGRITTDGQISKYPVKTDNSRPLGICVGPDGNVWFTENLANQIGRITPDGTVTEFPVPTTNGGPRDITAGPDGALWFTEQTAGKIGRITAAGSAIDFPIPTTTGQPAGITVGPDGAIWFTEYNGNNIGRMTTDGKASEYVLSNPGSQPLGITAGPDGALWFVERAGQRIGRISTTGSISEYPITTPFEDPVGITAGPDGALWYTEPGGDNIARVTTAGVITEYQAPSSPFASPNGIVTGPDGNLWYTEQNGNKIGRVNISNYMAIDRFSPPTNGQNFTSPGISSMVLGPDHALWFTEQQAHKIGRKDPNGGIAEYALPVHNGDASGSLPDSIIVGPDGALWFAEQSTSRIGRITTSGTITEFLVPIQPNELTVGPDGNIWFTSLDGIGRITPAGTVTTYSVNTHNANSTGITTGPDGALWFTEQDANNIGRITTDGSVTEYPIPTPGSDPMEIAASPDGTLWFVEGHAHQVGNIWPTGFIREFPLPQLPSSNFLFSGRFALATDGNLWFSAGSDLGRITTATSAITLYTIDTRRAVALTGITPGPDGGLWVGDSGYPDAPTDFIERVDLPISIAGPPTPISTLEGSTFSGAVATIIPTDSMLSASDFTATIAWGDGTTSAGQVSQEVSGPLIVTGSHTYWDDSNPVVRVTVADRHGSLATTTTSAQVADAPITSALGVPVSAVAESAAPFTVATFADANPLGQFGDFSTAIEWGDGTTSPGVISQSGATPSGVSFAVKAVHTYARPGRYVVATTILDRGGSQFALQTTAIVAPGPWSAASVGPISVLKDTLISGALVGAFTAPPSSQLSDFSATIDWGDGTPNSAGSISQAPGSQTTFQVSGDHTYLNDRTQPYAVAVTVHDAFGRSLAAGTTVAVADVVPLVGGIPVKMTKHLFFAAPVAFIVEPGGSLPEPPSNYTAVIDWGDNTAATAGTISAVPGGNQVIGSHTYISDGPFMITVTVTDVGTGTVTTTTTAFDPPNGAAPHKSPSHFRTKVPTPNGSHLVRSHVTRRRGHSA